MSEQVDETLLSKLQPGEERPLPRPAAFLPNPPPTPQATAILTPNSTLDSNFRTSHKLNQEGYIFCVWLLPSLCLWVILIVANSNTPYILLYYTRMTLTVDLSILLLMGNTVMLLFTIIIRTALNHHLMHIFWWLVTTFLFVRCQGVELTGHSKRGTLSSFGV